MIFTITKIFLNSKKMSVFSIYGIILLTVIYLFHNGWAVVIPKGNFTKNVADTTNDVNRTNSNSIPTSSDLFCNCGVFLTGQFVKGSSKPPTGIPSINIEVDEETFPCNSIGVKKCTTKCLERLVDYLPTSGPMICGTTDHDVFKERANLFVKNCNTGWINTRMTAGREYCCKNYEYYQCPNLSTSRSNY